MFDIFYSGSSKPNLFPHEQFATTIDEARAKCRTKFFWLIPSNQDLRRFNFGWLPPKWEEHQTHYIQLYSQWSEFTVTFAPKEELPLVENWHKKAFLRRGPNKKYWSIPAHIDSSAIDLSWAPLSMDPPYVYYFGTADEFQKLEGVTFTVPGGIEARYAGPLPLKDKGPDPTKPSDIFFIDTYNATAKDDFEALQLKYPQAQKVRFMNSWLETTKRCAAKASTFRFWVVSSENSYTNFDFTWAPASGQSDMTHVFGSQWQKWSNTFLVSKREFTHHATWIKDLEELPNLNFVNQQRVDRLDNLYEVFYIDHQTPSPSFDILKEKYPTIQSVPFEYSYFDTLAKIANLAKTRYVWITNSVCDYSKFDFTWHPEPWQEKMIHVFPSETQQFGDTFYLHVPSFKEQLDKIEKLDDFEVINYCKDQTVKRLLMEVVTYTSDSVVDAISNHSFTSEYAIFRHSSVEGQADIVPTLWSNKEVHVLSKSGSILVAPKNIKDYLRTQVYDYPYIITHKNKYVADKDLDIVFLSNGEPDAEKWFSNLVKCAPDQTIHRVSGINGRANAYKAAATVSTTPWFFAVFAKLEVDPNFDWHWQPDYMQEAKHYIFNAKNPVNGLVYGHQATLAYNKRLTLETEDSGLDFTLSKPHEVVDMLSGIAHFNVDPWTTWRTAIREVIKLRAANDQESKDRLNVWLTVAEGNNAEWCLRGAQDGIEYYESVNGSMPELLKTFEWAFLRAMFDTKYADKIS